MKIMERKYICKNGVVERTRYAVGDSATPRGRRKKGNSSFRKQEQNFNSSVRKVARILNCNCSRDDSLLITLDYDAAGLDKLLGKLDSESRGTVEELRLAVGQIGSWHKLPQKEEKREKKDKTAQEAQEALTKLWNVADHELELWLRRIKRKHGGKIRGLFITSDIDHETGELVRIHHHLVIIAKDISWDLIQKEWKYGGADIRRLRAQPDYTPIALYLMRQVRKQPEKKKYRVSQGMEQPVTEERVVLTNGEIKAPAGANVFERSEFNQDCVGQYIRYVPKKKTEYTPKGERRIEIQKDQERSP